MTEPVKTTESTSVEQRRQEVRRLRAAARLADRMRTAPGGERTFLRFSRGQRLEHQVFMVTFTALVVTGLLQRYGANLAVGWTVNTLFGGVGVVRILHRVAAIAFMLEAVYHAAYHGAVWFVRQEPGGMVPIWQDVVDLVQVARIKLGLAEGRPDYGRFSAGEKLEYYASVWGGLIMIVTGLVQWFPAEATLALPGGAIPIARAVHGWEALLAVITVLTWHIYHTVIKRKNTSIFTGVMTEEEMRHLHPKEYWRILAAHNYLQIAAMEPRRSVEEKK